MSDATPIAHVCLGDPTHIAFAGLVKPINCGSKERAAFIVRACNSHAQLVAALDDQIAFLQSGVFERIDVEAQISTLRAALSARGTEK